MSKPRVLVISTMFPNSELPVHAVFVQQRIQALAKRVRLDVCSPIPTFPLADRWVAKYQPRLRIPDRETQGNLSCHFPRFLSVPKVAKPLDGWAVYHTLKKFLRQHDPDRNVVLLDSHLAFPDGWAAVRLGRELGIPVTVTLRGHDINELGHTRGRRRMVMEALRGADRVFGVAQALCDGAVELGADPSTTVASSNGVDTERFQPSDRTQARHALGLPTDRPIILSVGHLVERKGFHHILQAAARLKQQGHPGVFVAIVGSGGEEGNFEPQLRALVDELGLENDVKFAGAVANPELRPWYCAADVFCLASEKEGWPNVVLESLACAVPVVATAVWGTPEILPRPELGTLVQYGSIDQLSAALSDALARQWSPQVLRDHALAHTWDDTAAKLAQHMREVVESRGLPLPHLEPSPTPQVLP